MDYYKSKNGYAGTQHPGNFFGYKHWDFTIFNSKHKMVFHATLERPYTDEEFRKHVDDFPEFMKMLRNAQ